MAHATLGRLSESAAAQKNDSESYDPDDTVKLPPPVHPTARRYLGYLLWTALALFLAACWAFVFSR